jgi:hypothetical protein
LRVGRRDPERFDIVAHRRISCRTIFLSQARLPYARLSLVKKSGVLSILVF